MTTTLRTPRHKIVAGEVRVALARAGKNQSDLARHLEISNAAASELCRGIVPFSIDRLDDIALWLDVRLSDLLGDFPQDSRERRAIKRAVGDDLGTHQYLPPLLRLVRGDGESSEPWPWFASTG